MVNGMIVGADVLGGLQDSLMQDVGQQGLLKACLSFMGVLRGLSNAEDFGTRFVS